MSYRELRYYLEGAAYRVMLNGRYVGHVRKRGRGWWAELPDHAFFPSPFGTRQTAAERLRQSYEGRRVA